MTGNARVPAPFAKQDAKWSIHCQYVPGLAAQCNEQEPRASESSQGKASLPTDMLSLFIWTMAAKSLDVHVQSQHTGGTLEYWVAPAKISR